MDGDTIAALSTPMGRGGIAVIRISGPDVVAILRRIVDTLPRKILPRRSYHGYVTVGGKHIDECVAVFFKGPHSYTGEDIAEISIHSNPLIVEEVLSLILSFNPGTGNADIEPLPGSESHAGIESLQTGKPPGLTHRQTGTEPMGTIRGALPGEFTFRAYKAGKMDLIQAESVNELINANSKYYAHMTFGSLEGRLSKILQELKRDLINLGVQIETKIEFEEDQFFENIFIHGQLKAPLAKLDTLLSNARFNDLLNKGLSVVIAGKVNVGKSSLFNTLLMEERSIISSVPGTTRDFIREKLYIDGFPIDITDVAGINRDTDCDIESQGIRRSLDKLETCDAVLFMLDSARPVDSTDLDLYDRIKDKKKVIIINKSDLAQKQDFSAFEKEHVVYISVKEHTNIEAVLDFLKELVNSIKGREAEFTVNQRQKALLEQLRVVLLDVDKMSAGLSQQAELVAEEIRRACDLIGKLMGEVTPDDILNKIFSEFCVGK
ncbi:MAG: tRNA modification GTPase [bacterium]|nr:tRNA modification GTPase [bacterium]